MSEKHYPYIGGSFDRIVFDGDGSVWVPGPENAKLQAENARLRSCLSDDAENARLIMGENAKLREQVTQLQDDWESERDYADQMEAKEKKAVDENAKLRELVKNLYECNGSCERCVELMGRCEYKEQLSELGIEVEE